MGAAASVDDVGVIVFSCSAFFFISSVCFFWWLTKPEREVNRLLQSSKVQMYSWISPTRHETQSTKTRMTASMNAERATARKSLVAQLAHERLHPRVFHLPNHSSQSSPHLVVLQMRVVDERLVALGAHEVLLLLCVHLTLRRSVR